jgi:sugar phosphate isomerase/epimerase
MQVVLNSKFFNTLSPTELGAKAIELGYDGIDVCVRPGHPVTPENVVVELPQAVTLWQSQGLCCPMATAPVTFVDPTTDEVERMYAGCAAAGVPRLKLGFFRFKDGDDYWQRVDTSRRALEQFAQLSEKYNVQTVYQVHSGQCLGSNCAGVMHLLRGFDPKLIGAYPDLGHILLDGEDYAMGLAMIRDYLSIVAIKDALYALQPAGSEPPYRPCFVPVGKGAVNWRRAFGVLKGMGYDGAFSVHTEYSFEEPIIRQVGYADTTPPNLETFAQQDAVCVRRVWGEVCAA